MDQAARDAKVIQTKSLKISTYCVPTLYRWMKLRGISIASERKMSNEAKELVADNILCAEMVPFSFSHKDGGEEIKPAAMAYIPDLWDKITDMLERNNDDKKKY